MANNEAMGRVEAAIREAQRRGDFDDFPGKGKPLELEEMVGVTAERRFDALLLRSCGEVSIEVALVREIRACRATLAAADNEQDREPLRTELRAKVAELAGMPKVSRAAATK